MPTYEYECKSCGHGFEVFQSMSDPPLKDCPECGNEVRRLIFGGTGVIFKGSGFYVTDKNKSSVRTSDKCKPEKKTESANNTSKESPAGGETSIERNSKNLSGMEPSRSAHGGGSEKPELKSKSA